MTCSGGDGQGLGRLFVFENVCHGVPSKERLAAAGLGLGAVLKAAEDAEAWLLPPRWPRSWPAPARPAPAGSRRRGPGTRGRQSSRRTSCTAHWSASAACAGTTGSLHLDVGRRRALGSRGRRPNFRAFVHQPVFSCAKVPDDGSARPSRPPSVPAFREGAVSFLRQDRHGQSSAPVPVARDGPSRSGAATLNGKFVSGSSGVSSGSTSRDSTRARLAASCRACSKKNASRFASACC